MSFGYRVLGFGSGGGPGAYEVEFLVVAGGGGSFSNVSGGGGGGGYRTSTQEVAPGTAITVTVGGGGTGRNVGPTDNSKGVDSSFSGTDLTTITSTGGGAGGMLLEVKADLAVLVTKV